MEQLELLGIVDEWHILEFFEMSALVQVHCEIIELDSDDMSYHESPLMIFFFVAAELPWRFYLDLNIRHHIVVVVD